MPLSDDSTTKVTLTACIIAHNESRVISRCLQSISPVCDEICLLDTGSTDDTSSIARRFGARTKVYTRCNTPAGLMADFSMARNACIGMASGRWILTIDADEVLAKKSGDSIRKHLLSDKFDAVNVLVHSGASSWPVPRLFRNLAQHRYFGRVHEWIPIEGAIVTDPGIVIRNRPFKQGKESSSDRDLRLCAAELVRQPNDSRMIFYLARALMRSEHYQEACEQYDRYLAVEASFVPGRHHAAHSIAVCHFLRRDWQTAIKACKYALTFGEYVANTYCLLGDTYVALKMYDKAIRAYQHALGCSRTDVDYPMFVDPSFNSSYPLKQLERFSLPIVESSAACIDEESTYEIKIN